MTNQEYIRIHKNEKVRPLALKPMPEGVNRTWVLQQIEGYQLAQRKLPRWAAIYDDGADLNFPLRLSLEQCSSESTAKYKRSIFQEFNCSSEQDASTFIDLTGGFGVDFYYLASLFSHAIYVEQQTQLCDVAHHNFPLLSLNNAEIINKQSEDFLLSYSSTDTKRTFFFLDPARRDITGNKVFRLEDCTPDITKLQDTLLNIGNTIMVKLSPMLDITQALRQLHYVTDVHVISVKGECKELLIIMSRDKVQDIPVTFHCVNLETNEDKLEASPHPSPEGKGVTNLPEKEYYATGHPSLQGRDGERLFLFEPNASIMKAGLQDAFGSHYGLSKLHPNSNLYVGKEPIPRVPARQFRIVDFTDFSKASLKAFLKDIPQANLTIRNFPSTVLELRKRLKLKEGGSDYLFATTLSNSSYAPVGTQAQGDTHVLIRCVKEN